MSDEDKALVDTYNKALELEKAGRLDEAAEAYRQVLVLNPEDKGGAAVRLAAMGRGPVPERASELYVETLFDQSAQEFEHILVDQLGYHVPLQLRTALGIHAPGPFERMLDLGCGTGLAGVAMADITTHRTGIDLSPNMIDISGEGDLYDELYIGDAVAFANEVEDEAPWNLIVATDVLPYLGAVEELFAGVMRVAAPGAVFAFSTEHLADEDAPSAGYVVSEHKRFHHAGSYLRRALATAGFTILAMDIITIRHQSGEPQPGHLVIAKAA